ncbi:Hypothetical predicted protein [Scomber scombrus]|uniref:Uncharacterized protein n=1 Tax=Scomber scombrus TaxID=13677 RepID=A0AAV1PW88_SCOSC
MTYLAVNRFHQGRSRGQPKDDTRRELSMQMQANEEFATSSEEPPFVSATQASLRIVWREDRRSQHRSFAQTDESLGSKEEASLPRSSQTDLSGLLGLCYS